MQENSVGLWSSRGKDCRCSIGKRKGVLVEDGGTFEKTQSMLASGAKKEVILGDEELLIRHHHKVTERYFNA